MSYCKRQKVLAGLSIEQLVERQAALKADPANACRNPGSIYLFTPATHRKLDDIASGWAGDLGKRCGGVQGIRNEREHPDRNGGQAGSVENLDATITGGYGTETSMSTQSSEVETMVPATARKQKSEPKPKAKAPVKAVVGPTESTSDQDRLVLHIGRQQKRCVLEAAAAHSEAAAGIPVSQVDLVRIAFARSMVTAADGTVTLRPMDPSMEAVANERSFSVRIFVPKAAKAKKALADIAKAMSRPGHPVHPVEAARDALCSGLMIVGKTKDNPGKAVLRPPL
jgi:hypothetical protein